MYVHQGKEQDACAGEEASSLHPGDLASGRQHISSMAGPGAVALCDADGVEVRKPGAVWRSPPGGGLLGTQPLPRSLESTEAKAPAAKARPLTS